MTLVTSGRATGRRCPVCGSPDGACGAIHAQSDPTPVDLPPKGAHRMPVDAVVRRPMSGTMAEVLGNIEEAEREGWEVIRRLDGKPYKKPKHKKREAPEPVKPEAPEPATPDTKRKDRKAELEAMTKPDVYDVAAALDVAGRSGMDKGQLVAAVLDAEA